MAKNCYLLRFDDICPTMNWAIWEAIERELVLHKVRPILAVVPDNRDPGLMPDPPAADFWERVRRWQAMGFTIAVHGYRHQYINKEKGLMRLTPHSEFAGLPYDTQLDMLRSALAIFQANGVRADGFVAPSHSFDLNTLKALREVGIKVISDGLWPWPHRDPEGMFWVPQQLWRFSPRPAGVWTVCLHHNKWSDKTLKHFRSELARYASRLTDVPTVMADHAGRPLTLVDRISAFHNLMWYHRVIPALGALRRSVMPSRQGA
ncbi:DUF2334 domain-containing protein [Mesoterricola silvestris]|uniref:DUF2334 domain-containing protein n=1 Tax=Mesoterricola silvestris TaxID=2927979 RepID=A0AA48K7E6_9BACT|nr:DUF2334 domain-containing protein [Mesoterricola silvestris]BDU71779.1 hypothetical protein METEAL_09530 [Mesoterricola silvestris]